LASAQIGTVVGDVSIAEAEEDQHAKISFRQFWDCDGDGDTVDDIIEFEVTALNIANDTAYTIDLPEGEYDPGTSPGPHRGGGSCLNVETLTVQTK